MLAANHIFNLKKKYQFDVLTLHFTIKKDCSFEFVCLVIFVHFYLLFVFCMLRIYQTGPALCYKKGYFIQFV